MQTHCILRGTIEFLNTVTIYVYRTVCISNAGDKEGSVITITSRFKQLALLTAKSFHPVTETFGPPMPPDFTFDLYLYYSHPQ